MRISDWSSDVCSSDLSAGPCDSDLEGDTMSASQSANGNGSVHDPCCAHDRALCSPSDNHRIAATWSLKNLESRSEEHTSELKSLMRNSYAVFCLKKKNTQTTKKTRQQTKKHNNKRN